MSTYPTQRFDDWCDRYRRRELSALRHGFDTGKPFIDAIFARPHDPLPYGMFRDWLAEIETTTLVQVCVQRLEREIAALETKWVIAYDNGYVQRRLVRFYQLFRTCFVKVGDAPARRVIAANWERKMYQALHKCFDAWREDQSLVIVDPRVAKQLKLI